MKKLLAIAAVAAVALTSCVKNEVITPDGEITFKDFTLSNKALIEPTAAANTAFPKGETFGAYALYSADNKMYVDNLEVSYKTSYWGFTKTQYWPKDTTNDKLDFYAYYPYSTTVASWDNVNTCVKFAGAALGTTQGDQVDYMVADVAEDRVSGSDVPVVFKHVTSMIVFNAVDATPAVDVDPVDRYKNLVVIRKIEVKQAAYTGDYTNGAWTNAGGRDAVVVLDNATKPVGTTVSKVTTASNAEGALIVVPETIQDDTKFVITYDLLESEDRVISATNGALNPGDAGYDINNAHSVEIKVNDLTTKTWEPGKKYSYTINFNLIGGENEYLEEITFAVTVDPWVAEAGGTYKEI